jgi:hypothetical protein
LGSTWGREDKESRRKCHPERDLDRDLDLDRDNRDRVRDRVCVWFPQLSDDARS